MNSLFSTSTALTHVLYVEDNPVDADLVRRALARARPLLDVRLVGSLREGQEALAASQSPQVVLCDLNLPDGSGLDLLNHLREQALECAFVILTGCGDQQAAVAALKGGADDYVVKDGDFLDRLPTTLEAAWVRARQERDHRSKPLRVLYAEHHSFDVDLSLRHLAQAAPHLRLDVVDSSTEVLKRLPESPALSLAYDVLLLDYFLPGYNALDLTKILRQERHLDIPIVMVTGHGSEEVAAQAIRLGVSDYLVKHTGYLHELPIAIDNAYRQVQLTRERQTLRQMSERLNAVLSLSPSVNYALVFQDDRFQPVWVSDSIERITGYTPSDVLAPRWWAEGLHPDDRERAIRTFAALKPNEQITQEYRFKTPSGTYLWIRDEIRLTQEARTGHLTAAGIWSDITAQQEAHARLQQTENRLQFLHHHDALTALPNRVLMLSRLDRALEAAAHTKARVAVLIIDLDRFKNINDSLGHPCGDALLIRVGHRLSEAVPEGGSLGRLGGDEFMVLLETLDHTESALNQAHGLLSAFEVPFALPQGGEVFIRASIGISVFPTHGKTADDLVRNADAAVYRAKETGRNTCCLYAEEMTRFAGERLLLETRLRRAVGQEEFVVFYQPVLCVKTGVLLGAEALVRWQPPGERMVPPIAFIPIAEETGLIVDLGEWVLRHACMQVDAWKKRGLRFGKLAVNLSPEQFRRQDVCAMVAKVMQETGFAPDDLELEITESGLMEQGEKAEERLRALKRLGVALAIDDFGTGYSSLAYLKRFAIDKLKIDRSFVKDIVDDRNDLAIAKAIMALAFSLEMRVQAEGVENNEQLALLRAQGCHTYQGYLCSPPLPAAEFEARFLLNIP